MELLLLSEVFGVGMDVGSSLFTGGMLCRCHRGLLRQSLKVGVCSTKYLGTCSSVVRSLQLLRPAMTTSCIAFARRNWSCTWSYIMPSLNSSML